jgi:hypothetical protein
MRVTLKLAAKRFRRRRAQSVLVFTTVTNTIVAPIHFNCSRVRPYFHFPHDSSLGYLRVRVSSIAYE